MTTTTPAVLTEADAMAAYRAIAATLAAAYGDDVLVVDHPVAQGDDDPAWGAGPVLCRDLDLYGVAKPWAVVWEGGPYYWADAVPAGGTVGFDEFTLTVPPTELPPGVGAETYCSFAVSLYRDDPVQSCCGATHSEAHRDRCRYYGLQVRTTL